MSETYIQNRNVKTDGWDWILVIGLSMAPMTSLRIWKIGPAELLCAIWCIRYLSLRSIKLTHVMKFFAGFIIFMLIGTVISLYKSSVGLSEVGIITWIYLGLISCISYSALSEHSGAYIESLADKFSCVSVIVYFTLYLYSVTVSRSLFGLNLWYGGRRFSPLGTNPHQIAVFMSALPFLFIRNAVHRKNTWRNLICAAICVFLMIQTESSTGIIALVTGFASLIVVLSLRIHTDARKKFALLLVEAALAALIILVFWSDIYDFIYNWIASDSNGLGRISIFSHIGDTFRESPLFGLGPGMHSETTRGGSIEYHCTYLEILAASGIAGTLVFIIFSIKEFKTLLKDPYLLPVMFALYAYGISGFAMRRLAYWGLTVFALLLAEKATSEVSTDVDDMQYQETEQDVGDNSEVVTS